jgi:hypothetical protein
MGYKHRHGPRQLISRPTPAKTRFLRVREKPGQRIRNKLKKN